MDKRLTHIALIGGGSSNIGAGSGDITPNGEGDGYAKPGI